MRVLIMGAAGMVGQKLLSRLENADTGLGRISGFICMIWCQPTQHPGLARAKCW